MELNCHTHFDGHVTMYGDTIVKKKPLQKYRLYP